jgi:hypothetical protein
VLYLNCIFVAFFNHFVLLLIKIPGIVLCLLCSQLHTFVEFCVSDASVWCIHSVINCNICVGILAGLANIL